MTINHNQEVDHEPKRHDTATLDLSHAYPGWRRQEPLATPDPGCKKNSKGRLYRGLAAAGQQGSGFDMGSLLDHTLTKNQPMLAVSYVHSHDDCPPIHGQNHRGHYVGDWFISQAYALILLRDQGYPMVADVDCLCHPDMIRRYMLLRQNCTYGHREDRFDHRNTVGWSFSGGHGFDNSMAVVITNGDHGRKWLPTHRPYTRYRDFTDAFGHSIDTNENGWAEFECPAGGTSVWVEETKYQWLKHQMSDRP